LEVITKAPIALSKDYDKKRHFEYLNQIQKCKEKFNNLENKIFFDDNKGHSLDEVVQATENYIYILERKLINYN